MLYYYLNHYNNLIKLYLDINRLRIAHKIGWRESEAIFIYRKYFRKSDPKVWKKFLKKVYKNNG